MATKYDKFNVQVVVCWVAMLCNNVVGYQYFISHWRWRQHGPLKCWYPTIITTWSLNPEDHDPYLQCCEHFKSCKFKWV